MQSGLADVLGRPNPGVARVVLEHWRCQKFRPIAILEYSLGLLCVLCLLPVIILAALTSDTDLELPNIKTRFYRRWHQLRLLLLDPKGQPLAVVDEVPTTAEIGQAAVASVLAAAEREGIVVVEVIVQGAGAVREVTEVWYGGRPLLAHPEEVNEERATALLRQHGLEIESRSDSLLIVEKPLPLTTGQRILGWLVAPLLIPIAPLLWLSEQGRRSLRHFFTDLRAGRSQTERVVCVRAESITTYQHRTAKDERWDEHIVDGAELLGVTFSPTLGYDEAVTRSPATLRLIGRRASATLPLTRAKNAERALRDLLVAATLRLREARPELGLLGRGPTPTRCPFCAALYVMQPGSRCPSCGAHAGTTP